MKKKKVFLILIILIVSLSNQVFALKITELAPKYKYNSSAFLNIGGILLGWIRNIAAVSLVVLLAFMGLRFMFGSLEQRADYKKSLMPLIIGTFVVLWASTITGILWNL